MKTGEVVILGTAVALLGVGAYFLFKPASPATAKAIAPAPGGGVKSTLGDPNDQNSVAFACNAAYKLTAIGHPNEAAVWAQRCTAGGGVVPNAASQLYV